MVVRYDIAKENNKEYDVVFSFRLTTQDERRKNHLHSIWIFIVKARTTRASKKKARRRLWSPLETPTTTLLMNKKFVKEKLIQSFCVCEI